MATSPEFLIRPARPNDLPVVVDLSARLALETEGKQLDLEVLQRGVARALADPERLRFWVAEAGGVVIGQAAVTREWSDWRDGWIWWFQSVYVMDEARGRGVFRGLHAAIRGAARRDPEVIGLRLYVEESNAPAQQTYRALGMVPGGYHVYEELWLDGERDEPSP